MRPSSFVTMMPSWMVLNSVSRNPFSRDNFRTKLCRLCGSTRSIRPISLSRNEVFIALQPAFALEPQIQQPGHRAGRTKHPQQRDRLRPVVLDEREIHPVVGCDDDYR